MAKARSEVERVEARWRRGLRTFRNRRSWRDPEGDVNKRNRKPSDNDQKAELLETQKKLAMSASQSKMKLLEEQKRVATEAAEFAKLAILEQKQCEKDALEATRAALAAAEEAETFIGRVYCSRSRSGDGWTSRSKRGVEI